MCLTKLNFLENTFLHRLHLKSLSVGSDCFSILVLIMGKYFGNNSLRGDGTEPKNNIKFIGAPDSDSTALV